MPQQNASPWTYNPQTGRFENIEGVQATPVAGDRINAPADRVRATPTEQIKALVDPSAAAAVTAKEGSSPPDFSMEALKTGVGALLKTAGLGAGIVMPGTSFAGSLLRGSTAGAFDALGEKVQGRDPGLSIESNILGEPLALGISKIAPKVGLRSAFSLGGFADDPERSAEKAFLRERERQVTTGPRSVTSPMGVPLARSGIAVGQTGRTEKAMTDTFGRIRHAEQNAVGTAKLEKIAQNLDWTEKGRTAARKRFVTHPIDTHEALVDRQNNYLEQQSLAATGNMGRPRPGPGVSPAQAKKLTTQQRRIATANLPNVTMNADQLGQQARRVAADARSLFEAKRTGAQLAPETADLLSSDADLASALKTARNHIVANGPNKGKFADLAAEDARYADLKLMQEVNDTMRGGGGVLTDVGQMGVRGGFGAGVGGNLVGLTGAPQGVRSLLGFAALPALSPKVVSKTGFAIGHAAKAAPTALRALNIEQDIENQVKRTRARRRNP